MKFLLPIQKQASWSGTNPNGKATDILCAKCLTHERHFRGGHSWSPDLCPCGCEDTIVWYNMNSIQKLKAQLVYWKNEEKRKKEL
jgi:hypothetical protein